VRGGGGAATTDTADATVSEDISGTSSLEDEADASDTSNTSDTDATVDEDSTSTASKTEDTSETSDTADTLVEAEKALAPQADGETVRQMAIDAETKELAVRDLHNVNVYLFESVYHDMRTTFKELDTEYYEAHGEDLSKNKDFFNAVFRAGLQSPQLKKELEIE
jgi:hypothetical protein